jgi:hypothetical protein
MRFFGVGDKVAQDMFALQWHPGQGNLADYQSKHHIGSHHIAVRPWYLHTENSPRYLPRALRPSTLKGCVGTLQRVHTKCTLTKSGSTGTERKSRDESRRATPYLLLTGPTVSYL